jgi:predicted DNA-binding transcriptional regulator AlpA
MTTEAPERLLNTDAVADILAVTTGTLRAWRSRGTGPASFRLGGRVVYRSSVIAAYIADAEAADADRDRK